MFFLGGFESRAIRACDEPCILKSNYTRTDVMGFDATAFHIHKPIIINTRCFNAIDAHKTRNRYESREDCVIESSVAR